MSRWQLAAAARPEAPARLAAPLHRIVDSRLKNSDRVQHFWPSLWNEAVRDYGQGNIYFEVADGPGEVRQSPGDSPIFAALQRGKINLVVTDSIPMYWDGGRAFAGVSTIHDGYHVSMIALRYAHRNQIAFLSVNTCFHEILHVLLQGIFLKAPKWYQSGGREAGWTVMRCARSCSTMATRCGNRGRSIFVDCARELRVLPEAPAVLSFATHDT